MNIVSFAVVTVTLLGGVLASFAFPEPHKPDEHKSDEHKPDDDQKPS